MQSSRQQTVLSAGIRRPVATAMFFLALALLGIYSWFKIPIELIPTLTGEKLFIQYYRPASEPEVVEREILIPLESRIKQLPGITQTWGEISSSSGSLNVEFEPGTNYRIRELELRNIAAELARQQPQGTRIRVSSKDTSAISQFVMSLQVLGNEDNDALRDFVEDNIQPQLESIEGVSQVFIFGGASKEVTILLDPKLCAYYGVNPSQVAAALAKNIKGLQYLGSSEENHLRLPVLYDARANDIDKIKELRISAKSPVLLRHVAEVKLATAPQKSIARVNGKAAISLVVFQEQSTNLIQLGHQLRKKINLIEKQISPYSISLINSYDASAQVKEQLDYLYQLALTGFFIALVVLYLFLKKLKAVAVIAIAVPMSLLITGALLYLNGHSLNLITLFGLVIGVGMLVDNSIVVYEAVQRNLEKGANPNDATVIGIRRTVRAIITASATNAIVFLPLLYFQEIPSNVKQLLAIIVPAILFPLAASLLVAIGLVPLLAQKLAAPAALELIKQYHHNQIKATTTPLVRGLFSGLLKVALRRPAPWVVGTFVSIVLTLIVALPWVLVQSISQAPSESEQIRIEVEFEAGGSLESAGLVFQRLEQTALDLDGVNRVESHIQEEKGTLTVVLKDKGLRPDDINAAKVRGLLNTAVNGLANVQLRTLNINDKNANSNNTSGSFSAQVSHVAVTGPEMSQINLLAERVKQRLELIPEIDNTWIRQSKGLQEILIQTNSNSLIDHRLSTQHIFELLVSMGREGQRLANGFSLANGREIPIVIRRDNNRHSNSLQRIEQLPLITSHGILKLKEFITIDLSVPPLSIIHQNGRREIQVHYGLSDTAPKAGPQRLALENRIQAAIHGIYLPQNYSIKTVGGQEATDWFKVAVIPILLLLYALLAVSFESMTSPLLIMLTVPLTIFGSIWALFISGMGIDTMAIIGVVVLLGISVNPAILLVDRMQQKIKLNRLSAGKAAIASVAERVRPVLMTSSTTIAAMWPLAIAKGQELEIWPPFATVVIGGLVSSTLLTLVIIPIGFILLVKMEKAFSAIGQSRLVIWLLLTTTSVALIISTGLVVSFSLQLFSASLIAVTLLWIFNLAFNKKTILPIDSENFVIETRFLSKVYGRPGPFAKACYRLFNSNDTTSLPTNSYLQKLLTFGVLLLATLYLAIELQSLIWRISFAYLSGVFLLKMISTISQKRFISQKTSKFETVARRSMPWLVLSLLVSAFTLIPIINEQPVIMPPAFAVILALLTFLVQKGKGSANLPVYNNSNLVKDKQNFNLIRSYWYRICRKLFSWQLTNQEHIALHSINFKARVGMLGIIGPNGAGKTTLFRILAGVLNSTIGTVYYANLDRRNIVSRIAQHIGFLPQEFGLPEQLTGEEYLNYFALLYQVGSPQKRQQRVNYLLKEVALVDKRHEQISTYSGGMKQRLAVARTLLRKPKVIIVDEPTAGLDPRERIRFRNLLSKLAKDRIVLFSTHVIEDVAAVCDRVLVIKKGSIVYDGKPKELAKLAHNKIWQVILPQLQAVHFEKQYNVINQIPEQGDMVNLRILANVRPHQQADVVESTVEDGYFHLFNNEAKLKDD